MHGERSLFAAGAELPVSAVADSPVKIALTAPAALTPPLESLRPYFTPFRRPSQSVFAEHSSSGHAPKSKLSSGQASLCAPIAHGMATSHLGPSTASFSPEHSETSVALCSTECYAGGGTEDRSKLCSSTTTAAGGDCTPPANISRNAMRPRGARGARWRTATTPAHDEEADSACNVDELPALVGSAPVDATSRRKNPDTKLLSRGGSGRPQTGQKRRSRYVAATLRRRAQDVVLTYKEASLVLDVVRKVKNLEMTDGISKGQLPARSTKRRLNGQVDLAGADMFSECSALTPVCTEEPAGDLIEASIDRNEAGGSSESKKL